MRLACVRTPAPSGRGGRRIGMSPRHRSPCRSGASSGRWRRGPPARIPTWRRRQHGATPIECRTTQRRARPGGACRRLGWPVTLRCRILLRPSSMTKKQYSSLNVTVGTVKKSKATITRWFWRKVNHRLPGSPRRRIRRRYRATVRSETTRNPMISGYEEVLAPNRSGDRIRVSFRRKGRA